MPRRVSHPTDVWVFAGVGQRVLRLGGAGAECANPGECPATYLIRYEYLVDIGVGQARGWTTAENV
jgi:hypothetical protein